MAIEQKTVTGALWSISTSLGSRLLALVGTLVLTRFIARDVYGEVSVAQVVVLTVHALTIFGLPNYVVAHPERGPDDVFHATVYCVVFGAIGQVAVVALGPHLGEWFGAPGMVQYLPGLAFATFIDRVTYIPERVIYRDMRFRLGSLQRAAGEIVYSGLSVGLAAAGMGGQAIVVGTLVRAVLRMVVCIAATERRSWLGFTRLRMDITRRIFAFGLPIYVAAAAYFAASRWDNLIISRLYGPATAGAYNYAYNLADVPATSVGEQIGDVLLPSFAHMNDEQRKSALAQSLGLLAILVFPLAMGLGAVAITLVRALFSPSWQSVGPMLMVLSALSVARPISWVVNSFLQAAKRTRPILIMECSKALGIVVTVSTLGRLGPLWACGAVGVTYAGHALTSVWVLHRYYGLNAARVLAALLRPLVACIAMVAAVFGWRAFVGDWGVRHTALAIAAEVTVGGAVYVGAIFLVAGAAARELFALLRSRKRKIADTDAPPPSSESPAG